MCLTRCSVDKQISDKRRIVNSAAPVSPAQLLQLSAARPHGGAVRLWRNLTRAYVILTQDHEWSILQSSVLIMSTIQTYSLGK